MEHLGHNWIKINAIAELVSISTHSNDVNNVKYESTVLDSINLV